MGVGLADILPALGAPQRQLAGAAAAGPAGERVVEPPRGEETPRDALTPRQRQVLDAVPAASAAGTDSIARTAGLGVREVRSSLSRLEEAGLVEIDLEGWRLTALART